MSDAFEEPAKSLGEFRDDLLVGRVAVVTGGGGAIGAATCHLLSAVGAQVVCADVAGDRVDQVVNGIASSGGQCEGVIADLTTPAGMAELVRVALAAVWTSRYPRQWNWGEPEQLGSVRAE